jgi:hypothetical protein
MKRVSRHGLIMPGDMIYVPATNLILMATRNLILSGKYTMASTANQMKNNGTIIYKFDL